MLSISTKYVETNTEIVPQQADCWFHQVNGFDKGIGNKKISLSSKKKTTPKRALQSVYRENDAFAQKTPIKRKMLNAIVFPTKILTHQDTNTKTVKSVFSVGIEKIILIDFFIIILLSFKNNRRKTAGHSCFIHLVTYLVCITTN